MGFASGLVTFQRLLITGKVNDEITDQTLKALQSNAFGRIPTLPDETQHGWIGPRHIMDADFDVDAVAFGQYLHLAIRVDKLKAPASIVRAYCRIEEAAAREAGGREYLSKGELRKCREAAVLRAEQEASAGNFRRMGAFPVLIDLAGGEVLVGTLGPAAGDRTSKLFSDTFGVALEPATPQVTALRLLSATRDARGLENLAAFHLVRPPDGSEATTDFPDRELSFLGRELLTWLWFRSDQGEGPLHMQHADEVTVMIDKLLRLKCDYGQTGVDTIMADGPAGLPEARAALRSGKQPNKAGLLIGSPIGELRLTLDGPRLTVSSLCLPENEDEKDARARLEQRFERVFDAVHLLDAVFELFLRERIGRDWERRLREMSAWARGDGGRRRAEVA